MRRLMARIGGGRGAAVYLGVGMMVLLSLAGAPAWTHGAAAPEESAAPTLAVADLGPGARLTRLMAARDDLYVIDQAAGHVRRYLLHGLPYAELFTQVMRWNEGANGLIMGRPIDLFLVGERLLMLDDRGSLWSYWGPDHERTLVALRLQSDQGTPRAVALHGSELLLLDPLKRQVWLYRQDAFGGYDTEPRALLPRSLPALAGATRLAVSRGSLLALLADGRVLAIPWLRPGAAVPLRLPFRATGIWASAARARFVVASARALVVLAPGGTIPWRVAVDGLGGESIDDVALSPTRRLYALTQTRILRVDATVRGL